MSREIDTIEVEDEARILRPGDLIGGRFEILRPLAEGGMGRVYVALQRPIDRQVALKVLRRELVSDADSVKRFLREAVAASKLSHPNTITIIDYGEDLGPIHYIAMEFLDGESLHQLLEREGCLPLDRAINIIQQIARSLTEAHNKGVIHRDLKPENIFISHVESGRDLVKVLDFGIARVQEGSGATRITRAGYVCGTPEYMSPEQARGEELDGRSDLYSLSILFWELLEGHPPYDAPSPLGIVLKHQNSPIPPVNGDFPASIQDFLRRGMAKTREERPDSAEIFLQELEAIWSPMRGALADSAAMRARGRITPPPQTPSPRRSTREAAMGGADTLDHLPTSPTTPLRAPRAPVALLLGAAALLLLLLIAGVAAALWKNQTSAPAVTSPKTTDAPPETPDAPPAPALTRLLLQTSPPGAEVLRDGQPVGVTPLSLAGEPSASAALEIRKEGFETLQSLLSFPAAGDLSMQYTLQPVEVAPVRLEIVTSPTGARVLRGDQLLGTSPLTLELKPQDEPFNAQLALDGYQPYEVPIQPADGSQSLRLVLEKDTDKDRVAANGKKPRNTVAAQDKGPKDGSPPQDKPPAQDKPPQKNPGNRYDTVD
jgi:serine/threonine protein kinase